MEDNRKKWIPPQLIVLGRGTPEENVLGGCKTSQIAGSSATKAGCKKKCATGTKCSVISKTS